MKPYPKADLPQWGHIDSVSSWSITKGSALGKAGIQSIRGNINREIRKQNAIILQHQREQSIHQSRKRNEQSL